MILLITWSDMHDGQFFWWGNIANYCHKKYPFIKFISFYVKKFSKTNGPKNVSTSSGSALVRYCIWKSRLLPKYYPSDHVAWKTKINLVLFRYGMFPAAELFYWSRRWSTLEIWVPNPHAFKEGKQLKCCWKIRKNGSWSRTDYKWLGLVEKNNVHLWKYS